MPAAKISRRLGPQATTAEGFPVLPPGPVPCAVLEGVIQAHSEDIEAVGPPGDGLWRGGQGAAERLPAAPLAAVPPAMLEVMVLAQPEDVQAVGTPGYRAHR
jgi:hypothetical protein